MHFDNNLFFPHIVEYKYVAEISQEISWKSICNCGARKLLLDESHDGEVFHNAMEIKESELEDYWLCTGIHCNAMGSTPEDQVNRDAKGQKAADGHKIENSQMIA